MRGPERLVNGCMALLAGQEVDDNLIIAVRAAAARAMARLTAARG